MSRLVGEILRYVAVLAWMKQCLDGASSRDDLIDLNIFVGCIE